MARSSAQPETPIDPAEVDTFFRERLPSEWFSDIEVVSDADEMLLIGTMAAPEQGSAEAAVADFREGTRRRRMEIAAEAQDRWGRKVSWGVRCGEVGVLFTHLAIPAMTRLRIKERRVLDTLVEAGVARSRSDALAWCVRLVGRNADEWLADLRLAMEEVDEVRRRGPGF